MDYRTGQLVGVSAVVLAFVLICCHSAPAQRPKVLAPHRPVAPRVTSTVPYKAATVRSITGALWMIDANFKSTIYLSNDVETSPITATPVLFLSNGKRYDLPTVTLKPAGTAEINVNDELAKQGIASWANLRGYIEVEYKWPWDALCGMVQNLDPVHSLIFTSVLGPKPDLSSQSQDASLGSHVLEGMWWKQESSVTGFVALSNLTSETRSVEVHVSGGNSEVLGTHRLTVSPHGTKLIDLEELRPAGGAGGISVAYDGPEDAIVVNGGLEDAITGYSAGLTFARSLVPSTKAKKMVYAAVGLIIGAADPMMSFPADTIFTPYTVVRNIDDKPVSVEPTLYWMEAGSARASTLKSFSLEPHRSQNIDVMALAAEAGLKNYSGMINLILEGEHKSQGLLIAAGSVDLKNTYVFEVTARPVAQSASKGMSYWSTRDGNDTMVTLWNPADEAQDLLFTMYFAGGHYALPIHLDARVTHSFNVSEIIQNQIPDKEGNIIPALVQEGSAVISGAQGENELILVAVDGGIYSVRKATCSPPRCITCNGVTSAGVLDNPFGMPVGLQHQLHFMMTWNTGHQFDYTGSSNWTSNHANIATVAGTGNVTGVSPGAVVINALTQDVAQFAKPCAPDNFPRPECPVQDMAGASGGTIDDFDISAAQSVKDGQSGSFSITVTGGTGQSYAWSFASPTGAGNVPSVNFTAATSTQTGTDGHWFALPDVACPTQAQLPAYYNATYTLTAKVTFQDGNAISKTTSLTVNSFWNPAGITDPNLANIGGIPAIASDENGVWRVTGMGTLSRIVPTSSTIFVIPTSQFYNKTVQHEQVHVNNWIIGAGHLYGDLFIPADFYNQIKNTTGTSQADLVNKLGAALTNYDNSQGILIGQRQNQDEHQAYVVSDSIAPPYVYQNCGRF